VVTAAIRHSPELALRQVSRKDEHADRVAVQRREMSGRKSSHTAAKIRLT
jgi:hypothetical protein